MMQRLLALLVTLLVAAAGFGTGVVYERHRPVPPPPGFFLGEFGGGPRAPGAGTAQINRAQLATQLAQLRPEIDTFRTHSAEIDAEFDRDLETVLTAAQRAVHDDYVKKRNDARLSPDDPKILTDDQISQLLQRPMHSLLATIVIPMRLDQLGQLLKFDDPQRAKVRDLLRVRREKFLELVDSSPPPSVMLSRLAPVAQRLGHVEAIAKEH